MKDYTTRNQRLGILDKEPTIKDFIFALLIAIVVADVIGAVAWTLSGQTPISEGYYLGKIVLELIK